MVPDAALEGQLKKAVTASAAVYRFRRGLPQAATFSAARSSSSISIFLISSIAAMTR